MSITTISNTISSVFLPALSSIQDNEKDIRQLVSQGIKTSMYFVTPMLMCLLVVAEPLVRVLLSEKWLPCVPLLQLFCVVDHRLKVYHTLVGSSYGGYTSHQYHHTILVDVVGVH